MIQYAVVFT